MSSETRAGLSTLLGSDNVRWVATSLVIPFSVFLWGQYSDAQSSAEQKTRRDIADKEINAKKAIETTQRNVELVIRLLPDLSKGDDSRERLNALAVIRVLEAGGNLSPELRAALEANLDALQDKIQPDGTLSSKADLKVVETLAKSAPTSAAYELYAAKAQTMTIPGVKAYIQIFDDAQRSQAEALQTLARGMGIAAPGIDNVVATSQRNNRTRPSGYNAPVLLVFSKADLAIGQALAAKAKDELGITLTIRTRWDSTIASKVPPGQLEIWMTDPLK